MKKINLMNGIKKIPKENRKFHKFQRLNQKFMKILLMRILEAWTRFKMKIVLSQNK